MIVANLLLILSEQQLACNLCS